MAFPPAGTACYHKLLKQFLITSPDYRAIQLPGKATESTSLALALVVLYATPAYHQQAAQVTTSQRSGRHSERRYPQEGGCKWCLF